MAPHDDTHGGEPASGVPATPLTPGGRTAAGARTRNAPVDWQRVQRLRQAIRSGSHVIDAPRTAARLLRLEAQLLSALG